MRDYLIHLAYNLSPLDIISLMVGAFFIGVFLTIIIRLKKTAIKYTYYDSEPYRQSLVVGHRGSRPVFKRVYSERFVYWLFRRLKHQWIIREAAKKIVKMG